MSSARCAVSRDSKCSTHRCSAVPSDPAPDPLNPVSHLTFAGHKPLATKPGAATGGTSCTCVARSIDRPDGSGPSVRPCSHHRSRASMNVLACRLKRIDFNCSRELIQLSCNVVPTLAMRTSLRLDIGNRTVRCAADQTSVFCQYTMLRVRTLWFPRPATSLQFCGG